VELAVAGEAALAFDELEAVVISLAAFGAAALDESADLSTRSTSSRGVPSGLKRRRSVTLKTGFSSLIFLFVKIRAQAQISH
jgi:hypothetical protein